MQSTESFVGTPARAAKMLCALFIVSIVSLVPLFAHAAGPNLIQNPSFETGSGNNATSWAQSSFGTNTVAFSIATGTASHTGSRAAVVRITTHTNGDAKWVFTPITVTPGQYYTFSNWYKSTTDTEVNLIYTTSGGESFVWAGALEPQSEWTEFQTSFLVPAGVTHVTVVHILDRVGTLTTDDYSLNLDIAPVFAEGRITFTFDDAWQSIYDNARPILNAKGIKTTQYIYSDAMNQVHGPSFMNETELLQMQTDGHDITAHSRTHSNLTTLLDPQLNNEIVGSRSDLTSAGFSPVDSYAYPFGAYNADIKTRMVNAGFAGARTVDEGYNFTNTDKFALKIQHVTNATTIADVQGWIENARQNKTWLILMFHEIRTPSGTCVGTDPIECSTTTLLQSIANYVTAPATELCILTMSQALAGTACGSTPTPTNSTPTVANVIPDQTTTEETSFSYAFPANTFADADSDTLTYSATLSSGAALPAWLTFTTGTRTFSGTPANADVGAHSILVRATDPSNASTTDTFLITVGNTNGAPSISAATFSIPENSATSTVVGTTTASDSDQGDTLIYSIVSGNTNNAFALHADTGVLTVATASTLDFETTPTFTLVIKVTDSSALSAQATTTINLTDVQEGTPTPTPTPTPAPQPASGGGGGGVVLGLIGQITVNPQTLIPNLGGGAGVVLGTSTFFFSKPLYWGVRGEEVTELHKILIDAGFLKISAPTGYFGPLTFAAVKLFQSSHNIESVGVVGPKTRAALNTH